MYPGAEYQIDLVPKKRIEVVAEDEDVGRLLDALVAAAQTGKIGDGRVWVTPIESIVRIRTKESGSDAV